MRSKDKKLILDDVLFIRVNHELKATLTDLTAKDDRPLASARKVLESYCQGRGCRREMNEAADRLLDHARALCDLRITHVPEYPCWDCIEAFCRWVQAWFNDWAARGLAA